jgi:hypothetical protein
VEHNNLLKRYVEEINKQPRLALECQPSIKCPCITPSAMFGFLSSTNQFRKDNDTHVGFLEDVMLYVIKGFLPMTIVEFV